MNNQQSNFSIIYSGDNSYSSVFTVVSIVVFWLVLVSILITILAYSASSCSCETTGTYFDIWRIACRPCA